MSHLAQDYAPPLRIGVVTYLNAKPLVHGLEAMLPKAQTHQNTPAESQNFQRAKRQADAALHQLFTKRTLS